MVAASLKLHECIYRTEGLVVYQGEDLRTSAPVLYHRLRLERWSAPELGLLHERLRLLSQLPAEGQLAVLDVQLGGPAPHIVQEWRDAPADALLAPGPLSRSAALRHLSALLQTLEALHRLGAAHGALSLASLRVKAGGRLAADFLQLLPPAGLSGKWAARAAERQSWTGQEEDRQALLRILTSLQGSVEASLVPEFSSSASGGGGPLVAPALLEPLPTGEAESSALPMGEASWTGTSLPGQPREPLRRRAGASPSLQTQEALSAREEAEVLLRATPPGVLEGLPTDNARGESSPLLPDDAVEPFSLAPVPEAPSTVTLGEAAGPGRPLPGSGAPGARVGRFELISLLGAGASGQVFLARDTLTDQRVALKLLRPELAEHPDVVRRMLREARLLARLDSPHVVRMVAADMGRAPPYLAMEYIAGPTLHTYLKEQGPLPEREALTLFREVVCGVAAAHRLGIVHRDLKPSNILLAPGEEGEGAPSTRRALVCDFGVARHSDPGESIELTGTGVLVGTPSYMSPEQARGETVDTRTDVYALGCTLFKMLIGKAPFSGKQSMEVLLKHAAEPAPLASALRPELSGGVTQLIQRMLAKLPADRFQDGDALLDAVDDLLLPPVGRIEERPRADERLPEVLHYERSVRLQGSLERLWPLVSNTDRLGHAMGFGALELVTSEEHRPELLMLRTSGPSGEMVWEERPYEWLEGRHFGVARRYTAGPYCWMRFVITLRPAAGGGTEATQVLEVVPRAPLTAADMDAQIGRDLLGGLIALYQRLDQHLSAAQEQIPWRRSPREALLPPDAFTDHPAIAQEGKDLLALTLPRLAAQGISAEFLRSLEALLAESPAPELAHIRPLSFAAQFGLDEAEVLSGLYAAALEGLLELQWSLICPTCRATSTLLDTLRDLRDHASCQVCNLGYPVDISRSVELIFRLGARLGGEGPAIYCIGGPGRFPHVLLQLHLGPGEAVAVEHSLRPGSYRFTAPQRRTIAVEIRPDADDSQLELVYRASPVPSVNPQVAHRLRGDPLQLTVRNDSAEPALVRLERVQSEPLMLSAAQALKQPLFRELFPDQLFTPELLFSVAQVVALRTRAAPARRGASGPAWRSASEHIRQAQAQVKGAGGEVTRVLPDGVEATFPHPLQAYKAALGLLSTEDNGPSMAIDIGPATLTTVNGRLEHLGEVFGALEALLAATPPGGLTLSERAALDPGLQVELGRLPSSLVLSPSGEANLQLSGGERPSPDPPSAPRPRATPVAR